MYLSNFFIPAVKDVPREAEIVSHRLMLRAGFIRQHSAGIYSWLPLGLRVLRKVENIVREEQLRAGAIEMLMPTIQSADLWRESGRYDDYGKEMLRIVDRHERDMLYGPTNEEMITDIFRAFVKSYKDLPLNLFHIQLKFRDEVRPRFGVMRSREFLMKDGYSFDIDEASSHLSYYRMFVSYLRTFARLGMRVVPMRAATGPIGGNLSHEFLMLAQTGESELYYHKAFDTLEIPSANINYQDDKVIKDIFHQWTKHYSASDDLHDEKKWQAIEESQRQKKRGIEIGHIFHFGTKYSKAMQAQVAGPDGKQSDVFMGSYGIGPSRVVAALIEGGHDDAGIIWHKSVAPFAVVIINLRVGEMQVDKTCVDFYEKLSAQGYDVLYDDKQTSAGEKFTLADLIGMPYQLIVGPKSLAKGEVEIKVRKTGERHVLSIESALNYLVKNLGSENE